MKSIFTTTTHLSRWFTSAFFIALFTLVSQVVMSQVTYSTEVTPAGTIDRNTTGVIYTLKIDVGPAYPVTVSGISFKTTGTYAAGDIKKFDMTYYSPPTFTNPILVASSNTPSTGSGETVSFTGATLGTIKLDPSTTAYFLIRAELSANATADKTVGINGKTNPVTITYSLPANVDIVNLQDNNAGLKTILAPSVTYTTEPVTDQYAPKSAPHRLVYAFKMATGSVSALYFDYISIKTTGTYRSSDVSQFKLWKNSTPSLTGATDVKSIQSQSTGSGETLSFNYPSHTDPSSTVYFLITAEIAANAITGRTLGIDGPNNELSMDFYPVPTVIDNQTNAAVLKTIIDRSITYSTEPLTAGNALQSANNHPLYTLKVVNEGTATSFNSLNIKTNGTYSSSDINEFKLWQNNSPGIEGATLTSTDASVTGAGETLSFSGSPTLAANSTTYFLITANVNEDASPEKTFGVNGATNELSIAYPGPSPVITNNQTNVAGLQTILLNTIPTVTYTTEAVPEENVLPGVSDNVVYVLKVVTSKAGTASINNLSINTIGTYTSSDISQFKLWRNSTASVNGASTVGTDASITGNGETLSFTGSQTLAANSTTYFLITANVKNEATVNRTFGINGATNNLNINYSAPNPTIINKQTDVAGLKTIFDDSIPSLTYTTETVPAKNIPPGANDNVVYLLKVVTNDVDAVNFTNLSITTHGSYTSSDISQFKLWRNNAPTLSGASAAGSDESITGSGETLSFSGSETLEASSTTYFLITANSKPEATLGRTFGINGASNSLNITYTTACNIINNQSNAAGLQTIAIPNVTYSTEPLLAENVTKGAAKQFFYVVKIVNSGTSRVSFNNFTIKTTGTYSSSDISQFRLWRSDTPNFTPASPFIQSTLSTTGAGETISFPGQPHFLDANSTRYYGFTADVSENAIAGKTFGVDGTNNNFSVTYFDGFPVIANNQTNIAGLKTIGVPNITYTTETSPLGNVLPGTDNDLTYILKVVTSTTGPASFSKLDLMTSGNYTSSDVSQFKLWRNSTASLTGASEVGVDESVTGNGETLSFSSSQTLDANSTNYFLVTAKVKPGATSGRTIGINGANNNLSVAYLTPQPSVITNSQSNKAGLRTIIPTFQIYSTEPLSAGSVANGTTDRMVYVLKVELGNSETAQLNNLALKTIGTYTSSDISHFKLWRNSTPSLTGATVVGTDDSITGNGETLSFSGSDTLAAKSTTYFLITANVELNSTNGRTFGVNGADNSLSITYLNTPPAITDNQTNVAGLQTIASQTVTYTTEPLAAENVLPGATNRMAYVFKMVTGSVRTVEMDTLSLKTTGSYSSSDISTFTLLRKIGENAAWQSFGQQTSVTGAGETISFAGTQSFQPNTTIYFALQANIREGATPGKTFGVDGSTNPVKINYLAPKPSVLNSQTNVANLQTIGRPTVTYATESLPAGNVSQGSVNQPVYILKVTADSNIGATLTNLNIVTSGTYGAGDITSFTLYKSDSPDLNGGTPGALIGTDATSTGAGETLTFATGSLYLDAGSTTYLIVKASIAATGTINKTVQINGAAHPAVLSFSGASASVTDNQTNVAGAQTIRPADECSGGEIIGETTLCGTNDARYTFTNPTAAPNGTWSSLNEAVLTISAETGEASPGSSGTTKIRYTVPSDCDPSGFIFTEKEVRVISAGKIDLPRHICDNETGKLDLKLIGGEPGGVWSSSYEQTATISDGGTSLTVVGPGYTLVSYTVTVGNCTSTARAEVTIHDSAEQMIDFPEQVCIMEGQNSGIIQAPNGTEGVWSLAPLPGGATPDFASIDASTGELTVTGSGTITIEYNVSSPCSYKLSTTTTLNYIRPITGPDSILINGSEDWLKKYSYSSGNPAGGTWTSLDTTVATIDQDGKLTPIRLGITALTYVTNEACGDKNPYKFVYIQSIGEMSGPSVICGDNSGRYQYTVSNTIQGGTWKANGMGMGRDGVFIPYYTGDVLITYTPPINTGGLPINKIVKVHSAGFIQGERNVCLGTGKFSYDRFNSTADDGKWTSSNPAVASVDQTGEVTLHTVGTTIISYTLDIAACGQLSTSKVLNVGQPDPSVQYNAGNQVLVTGTNPLMNGCILIGTINSPALAASSTPHISVSSTLYHGFPISYSVTPGGSVRDYAADLVLYFYQTDFDVYNLNPVAPLPTGPTDVQGAANVRITHYSDGYPTEQIRPSKVTWNAGKGYWEVAFSITHFSDFLLAAEETALPVTLTSFNAFKQENQVELRWATSIETNSEAFEIEHSADAKQWKPLGTVKAQGESQSVKNYTYLHATPIKGWNYYRLKMVDRDNTFAYSRIQSIQMDQVFDLRIFPNPVSGSFTIETADWKNVKTVRIFNLTGTTVYNSAISGLSKSIDVKSLVSGNYVVELLLSNGQTKISRIVVTR